MKKTATSLTTVLVIKAINSLIGASEIMNETEAMFSWFVDRPVVKRSYSRAIFRSFRLTQSHSFSPPNSLTF